MKIDELNLSVRTANCLRNADYMTVADLMKVPPVKHVPNFREREWREIVRALARVITEK